MSSPRGSPRWPGDRGDGDVALIFARNGASRSEITDELLGAADASLRCQPPCEEKRHARGTAELASAQSLQEQGPSFIATSSSSLHPETAAHDTTDVSPTSRHSSTGSTFWAWLRQDWGLKFFIRVDIEGSFHTYPPVGGPFQSLQEAEDAIDRHLQSRQVQKMCMEQAGVSRVEMAIRTCLYWPDGTRKKCSQSQAIERCREERRIFAQVLVENYNKDHNLGDNAYELKDIVHYKLIVENYQRLYYHFNFIAKTRGAEDCGVDNLFFAEVMSMRQGEHEDLVISCFCMVKSSDNGHCYGCLSDGVVDMKHPNEASAFIGGHLDNHMPLTRSFREWSDEDEEVEEARIRHMYKGQEKPGFVKKLLSKLPPDVRRRCMKKKLKSSEKKVPEE
ncbi:hypothetical protein ACQ4PT_062770 [Festuca glaucescens]